MYRLAGSHDPESMAAVGRRVYRAMAAAGYGAVGEFHYVVHQSDGTPYAEPNAMAIALAEAAVSAGLRSCCCRPPTQRGGFGIEPAEPGQRRFCRSRRSTCSWSGWMRCGRGPRTGPE